ncbi:MAG: PAS domain S-box protein [Firmicutes bacterium]|nr:PAS domain S-box protein [Bacillota bacterium]
MPFEVVYSLISSTLVTLVPSLVYFFLYYQERQRYLLIWGYMWLINSLAYTLLLFLNNAFFIILLIVSLMFCCYLLAWGTCSFLGKKIFPWLLPAFILITFWCILAEVVLKLPYFFYMIPELFSIGALLLYTGFIYLKLENMGLFGKLLTGWSFILLGIYNILNPFTNLVQSIAPWLPLISILLKIGIALGTIILHFEKGIIDLKRSKANYKALVEGVPDIIFSYSLHPEAKTTYISPAMTRITGYSPQEFYCKHTFLFDIVDKKNHATLNQLFSGKYDYSKVTPIICTHKNGSTVYLEIYISPIYDHGKIISLEGVARNVTTRKVMEEKLRQIETEKRKRMNLNLQLAEDRFKKAFYSSPNIMAVISIQDGKLIDVNKSFESTIGYRREEVLGKTLKRLNFYPKKRDIVKLLRKLRKQEQLQNEKIQFNTKSDNICIGLLSAEKILLTDKDHLLVAVNDITKLEYYEREMAHIDRLHLIGQMASSINHEVRNPLTTVRGFLQMLGGKNQYVNDKNYFRLMISELDRATSIIAELLLLSKEKPIERKYINLNNIIENIYPLLQADAIIKKVDLVLELQPLPDLYLDRKAMIQVILNLVRNALEASPGGGKVSIATSVQNEEFILSVSDQGSGIDSTVIEKLGTPFITTKENGTGLGLAICYSIVHQHRAKIYANTNNNGTTFIIKFNKENKNIVSDIN